MITSTDLLSTPAADLDALFSGGRAVLPPEGLGAGQALAATGTAFARPFARATKLVAWKGKRFADGGRSLRNVVTPFDVAAVSADVAIGESWYDGEPCVVLDYSKTSWVARWVRDEIREVAPGCYVGLVYLRSKRLPLRFSLQFDPAELRSRDPDELLTAS